MLVPLKDNPEHPQPSRSGSRLSIDERDCCLEPRHTNSARGTVADIYIPQTVFTLKGFWRIKGLVNQCRGCSVQRSPPIAEKTHIVFILAVFTMNSDTFEVRLPPIAVKTHTIVTPTFKNTHNRNTYLQKRLLL